MPAVLIAVRLDRLLVLMLVSFCGVLTGNCQQTTTITIDNQSLPPDEAQRVKDFAFDEMLIFVIPQVEAKTIQFDLSSIISHLNDKDKKLESSIVFGVKRSEEANAWAYKDTDGLKHIKITTGLYRYLDDLITAQIMSYRFNAPKCGTSYADYIFNTSRNNFSYETKLLPPTEVMTPEVYARRNPNICPVISPDTPLLAQHDDWLAMYNLSIRASVAFVLLHEFAHFKHGDIDQMLPLPTRTGFKISRKREISADKYALKMLTSLRISPILALPLLYLIAGQQDYNVSQPQSDDHPLAFVRVKAMIRATRKSSKSKNLDKWLRNQGFPSAKSNQDFVDYLNRVLY